MAQSISPAARDLYRQHCDAMRSITEAQMTALNREVLAKNAANFNGADWRDNLIQVFEREARAREAGSA